MDCRGPPYDMHTSPTALLRRVPFSESMMLPRHLGAADGRQFGTVRRPAPGKRGACLLARLVCVGQSGISVRRVGGNRAGEMRFTRFLRNRRVRPDEMVATARARTAGLVKGRHILAIQDTTTLRDDGKQRSLNLHPMIAVDAHDGALLGLVDAVFLSHVGGRSICAKNGPSPRKRAAAGLMRQRQRPAWSRPERPASPSSPTGKAISMRNSPAGPPRPSF